MKKLSLLFVCILTLASCEKDVLTEEVSIEETMQNSDVYSKKGNKVAVCHKNGKIIYVNANAVKAHVAHGDAVDLDGDGFFDHENSCVTIGVDCDDTKADVNPDAEEIYDNGIDNNCNGVIGYTTTSFENAECSECANGTGNYYRFVRGVKKCRFFDSPPTNANWIQCKTEVEVYID